MIALLMVDVQNDFCPGGALAVDGGDEVVAELNRLADDYSLVVATADWHPPDHGSFASQHPGAKPFSMGTLDGRDQVMWPDHCVQGSPGAEPHPAIRAAHRVFIKGIDPKADSYSGFYDANGASTGLADYLQHCGVTELHVGGLATDYCVKFTVLDALKEGFEVTVFKNAVRAVNTNEGDGDAALQQMQAAGATIIW